jgi:hypothetical protein
MTPVEFSCVIRAYTDIVACESLRVADKVAWWRSYSTLSRPAC